MTANDGSGLISADEIECERDVDALLALVVSFSSIS